MEKILVLTKNKSIVKIAIFSVLLLVSIIAPAIVHDQRVTGPIVNTVLFVATAILAPEIAILIGLLQSIVALSNGLLPVPLAPMVPFIMISNTILILSFHYLKKKNFWTGVVVASALKFLFLFGTSTVVINLLLKKELAKQVSLMMSWPQLFTALTGGIIAYLLLEGVKKIKKQ